MAAAILVVGVIGMEFALRPFVGSEFVGPSATRYDPYYGRVVKPGYAAPFMSDGRTYEVAFNALGFRGPDVADAARGAVLFLGDSSTFGVAVDDDAIFPELVRRALADRFGEDAVPVLNTAMIGSGQGRWLRFLRRDADRFAPRIVVMQFGATDFGANRREGLYEIDDSGELREVGVPPQSAVRSLQERVESLPWVPHSRIYAVVKQTVKHVFTEEGGRDDGASGTAASTRAESGPGDELTYRIIEACLEECRERGWPVIALSAPLPDGERRNRVMELVGQHGHGFVEIPTAATRPDLYFPSPSDRWNAEGHRLVADALLEQILSHPAIRAVAFADRPAGP